MKRTIVLLLAISACALLSCARSVPDAPDPASAQEAPILGGWQEAKEGELSEREREIFSSAAGAIPLAPEKLLATQVVSGINYRFAARDADGEMYTVTVWTKASGESVLTRIEDAAGRDVTARFAGE